MDDYESAKGKTENLILSKKDEQERVQKKTFTNWINTYLVQAHPPYKIEDLFESIKDGLCLIHLLEVMTGEKLRKEQPKNMQKIHRLSNINAALDFLKNRKIKLVNINATDIADGRPSIVLGLMWTVILFFQIEEQEEILIGALGADFDGKVNAKGALLNWVNKTIGEKYNLNVKDFGPSWRDGKAFNALVHNIDSSLINWDDVKKKNNKENLLEAFKQAEQLGIPHILDAQDVDVAKPDEKSIMTYITQFLKSYPDGGKGIEEDIVAINKQKEEAYQRALEEEEERLRLEEEERKRKEAEERKRKEEEERKRKEEEERKRKEEEERKRKEEERQRKEEEERKRKEEERRRKEEEERKRKEEERQRKEEEERKRKKEEEEKKRKEEEERKKLAEEEIKRKKCKEQLKSMSKWVEDLDQFLEDDLDCDNEAICNYLENLSGLLSDKDLIDEDLTLLKNDVKSGKCGSEYIKPLLNDIQNLEKQLKDSVSKAANVKNSLNHNRDQMKACDKSLNQVEDWINNFDNALEKVNSAGNPDRCDEFMNKFRAHLSTEPTAQHALKEAREMYSKLKSSAPKNLKDSFLLNKMQDLESKLKDRSETGKAIDKSLKDFDKSLSKAKDWQNDYQKKMNNLGPLPNDVTKLKQQLEKLENLKRSQGDGDKVVQEAIEKGQAALSITNNLDPIQKKIHSDLESVENKWLQNTENLDHLKDEIMGKLSKVEGVMQTGNKVENWLKDKEADLKSSKGLCDTLSQKLAKIDDLKKLLNDIESESPILEDYFEQLEEIGASDPNSLKKLNLTKQHLNNIKQNIKNAIDEAEGRVASHQEFIGKLDEAGEWLEMAKALKLDAVMTDIPGNTEELKRRKEIIEKLIESKNNGESLVKAAFSSGEAVARETSLKGKEDILNGVRGLNKDFLDLLDGLGAAKQTIEMKLTKASNLNRDLDTLAKWSDEFEKKLDNMTDSDLDKIKLLCDDAQAKLYLVDNLYNQAKSMDDPEFQAHAERIKAQIKENLSKSQQMYSQVRENMNMYNDLLKSCKNISNWINESEKKLMRYGESTASNPEELNNNLKLLEKLSEDVKGKRYDIDKVRNQGQDLSIASPSKSMEIESILKKIGERYEDLTNSLERKEQGLRDNIKDQRDFEDAIHKAQYWLNEATQRLLKHSDIKQCTPSLVDAFCRNFEEILDSIPYGEEAVNTAMYIGQNHLAHLNGMKLQGMSNLERDTKRLNELDKNWNDFKKQIDIVNKNVHRVKDNLDEFNLLQQKLEGYLKGKENCLNESLSLDSLKYIINEVDDAAKDLDKLQAKAIEVNGNLNYPNATTIAKGIVDKFQNLKRSIEAELNKAKQLDNDWAAYKNAVNACEKWIVDTGFRIIENDYSAFSPEDAQARLDDHSRICDQINNFSQDVDRVVKMGKQLANKVSEHPSSKANSIPFTHHSESEIQADIDNLQGSHKSLVENANETKSRLQEQLVNWRKYRDLVQVNDQFLSSELADWWKDKKHFPPKTNEEANKNIKEAKEILKNLLSRQAEMKISKSNCQSLSMENGPRDFSALAEVNRKRRLSLTTPLSRLAESVETGLEKNIEEIQKYIPQLENLCQDWNNFDKDLEELENWTKDKEKLFEKKIGQPSMKKSSLTEEQRQVGNQLKKEIENHERKINNLLEKAQTIGSRKVNPILKRIEELKRKLKQFLERKDEGIDAVDFDHIDKQTVACQNSGTQNNVLENIATQTLPEKYNISTSTEPRVRKTKTQTIKRDLDIPVSKTNHFGMRNSGGNRGISKMLYPYCCTSDLLNQKLNLDFVHESPLKLEKTTSTLSSSRRENDYQPTRLGISKVRNGTEESVRRNWIPQDLL